MSQGFFPTETQDSIFFSPFNTIILCHAMTTETH